MLIDASAQWTTKPHGQEALQDRRPGFAIKFWITATAMRKFEIAPVAGFPYNIKFALSLFSLCAPAAGAPALEMGS
jgi:hypothetical protein